MDESIWKWEMELHSGFTGKPAIQPYSHEINRNIQDLYNWSTQWSHKID